MVDRDPITNTSKKAITHITQDEVIRLFHYDPTTGHLTRKIRAGTTGQVGGRAGSVRSSGYRSVRVNGTLCVEHRIIWLWWSGAWPYAQIDHINGIRDDNRIANLRIASTAENQRNSGTRSDNSLGVKGVYRVGKKFRALIQAGGSQLHLGYFPTKEAASEAYKAACTRLHGDFARTE